MDTIARGEVAEAQIDAFIERRARKGETDPDEREEPWKESVRRHQEALRRENRAGWYGYHMHMSELHERLSREHEATALGLLEDDQERS